MIKRIVTFTTSKGRGRTKLKHDINPKTNKEVYVLDKTKIAKNGDFYPKPFKGYRVHKDDKSIIESIKRKKK